MRLDATAHAADHDAPLAPYEPPVELLMHLSAAAISRLEEVGHEHVEAERARVLADLERRENASRLPYGPANAVRCLARAALLGKVRSRAARGARGARFLQAELDASAELRKCLDEVDETAARLATLARVAELARAHDLEDLNALCALAPERLERALKAQPRYAGLRELVERMVARNGAARADDGDAARAPLPRQRECRRRRVRAQLPRRALARAAARGGGGLGGLGGRLGGGGRGGERGVGAAAADHEAAERGRALARDDDEPARAARVARDEVGREHRRGQRGRRAHEQPLRARRARGGGVGRRGGGTRRGRVAVLEAEELDARGRDAAARAARVGRL